MPVVQVNIAVDVETNNVQIGGNALNNPVVTLGVLEMAKVQYLTHLKQQAEQLIQPATGVVLPKL